MSTPRPLLSAETTLPGASTPAMDPSKRAMAKKKAAERAAKQSRKPQSGNKKNGKDGAADDGPKDILDYLFDEFEKKEQEKERAEKLAKVKSQPKDVIGMMVDDFNKKKQQQKLQGKGIPTKIGDDGDAVLDDSHMPSWMRNAADPLGIEKAKNQIIKAVNPKAAVPDILDITPRTRDEARRQLKALYDEEPTEVAVNNYWADLQARVPKPKSPKRAASPKNLKTAAKADQSKYRVMPNGVVISEDPKYLAQNPNAMTWNQFVAKDAARVKYRVMPNGQVISEDKGYLKYNPNAKTWKQYTQEVKNKSKANKGQYTKLDDGTVITEDPEILKSNPKAITQKTYQKRVRAQQKHQFQVLMNQGHKNGGNVDQKVVDEAVQDLKELLGRKPTPKEVEQFLEDIQEGNPNIQKQNFDPFGFGDIEVRQTPYSTNDAYKSIREMYGHTGTNREVNDWLREMNQPWQHQQSYLDGGLPGYTNTLSETSMMNSTNVFFVLLAAGAAAAAYKWRKRETDDEFVKAESGSSLFDKLLDPFHRNKKNDGDDDFDKVL